MADPRKELGSKYLQKNRFANFGSVVNEVTISGFRGVNATIALDYPVTALTGFNGSGKSTIGQLLLCGYRKLTATISAKRFYVKDFFPVSVVDPTPFTPTASITFRYQTDKEGVHQDLTVTRAQKEWGGYKRQPERNTEYVGFTVYIPKVERKDISIYNAATLKLQNRDDNREVHTFVNKILGAAYDEIYFQGVSAKTKSGNLGMASRLGSKYSENNMGFGEGRIVYTVRLLETCPKQSLIVLEEPETSLHETAQYELAKYLIDVSNRRGHQIIFTTHSGIMMDALPPEGRKLLVRNKDGVDVFDNISSARIRTALSSGSAGHVVICVEDNFAQSLLREVLRRFDVNMLDTLTFFPFGNEKSVASALLVLKTAGVKSIAVKDGDMSPDPEKDILTLPGTLAPEKEVFQSQAAKSVLLANYSFDLDQYLGINPETNHHDYSKIVADKKGFSREVIESDCIRAFLDEKGSEWANSLCEQIKARI